MKNETNKMTIAQEAILYARKNLINSGDTPLAWYNRVVYQEEMDFLIKIGVDKNELERALDATQKDKWY